MSIENLLANRELLTNQLFWYVDDALQDLFEEFMELTPKLIGIVERTLDYTKQYQQ
jgi:hypothetical protein